MPVRGLSTKFSKRKLASKHILWVSLALVDWLYLCRVFHACHHWLAAKFADWDLGSWEIFWTFFYAFATYGNAGFMREQVCKYMCPYARFQSAMFDKDTLIVTYDAERGEPRGARSKKADPSKLNLGPVWTAVCVCRCAPPALISAKALQYECIGCGACADVCDTVMDKMGYPRGLVKYSTENAMQPALDPCADLAPCVAAKGADLLVGF
jgi:polyferredoxin